MTTGKHGEVEIKGKVFDFSHEDGHATMATPFDGGEPIYKVFKKATLISKQGGLGNFIGYSKGKQFSFQAIL